VKRYASTYRSSTGTVAEQYKLYKSVKEHHSWARQVTFLLMTVFVADAFFFIFPGKKWHI